MDLSKYLVLGGRKGIADLIQNPRLNKLIKVIYLSKTQVFLIELCQKYSIPWEIKDKGWFSRYGKLGGKNKHRYALALLNKKEDSTLEQLIEKNKSKEKSLIVLLDHIQDPFNLGAILRTCSAAGVDGLIMPKDHQAPINNNTTLKSSSGYALNVDVVGVKNLTQTINTLKENGYWIYSADSNEKSKDFKSIKWDKKTVLVLGSEGTGVSPLITKNSDFIVHIPMKNEVDSLNVSVAAGILIYEVIYNHHSQD